MNTALLQYQLSLAEINQLLKEFPQFLFLSYDDSPLKQIPQEHWPHIEVLFSSHLSPEELKLATQLRWIHCPSSNIQRLSMNEIEQEGNILVTLTKEENASQVGESVIGSILCFAKNLYQWKEVNHTPMVVWDSKWRHSMWTLADKTLLQVGLGKEGSEIAFRARQFGMKVWGMDKFASFHPNCHKTFAINELSNILPLVDVVSITLNRDKEFETCFTINELNLMKEDSILIITGSSNLLDEDALAQVAKKKKFRGIVLDAQYQTPISLHSPLWGIPNLIITPEISPRPKTASTQAFRTFLYNMRQYVHGNYADMKNLISSALITSDEEYKWNL